MQNLKNFLISLGVGLIVFGICAVLLVHFGTKRIIEEESSGTEARQEETVSPEAESSGQNDSSPVGDNG